MIEKLPFFILITLGPYQIYRILKGSDHNKRLIDILSGGVIIILCASSWPIHLNIWICFSTIGLLFSSVMAYEGYKEKKAAYWFTSIMLLIMSAIFLMLYTFHVSI